MYVVDPYQYIALFALYLVIIYSLPLGYSAELDKDAGKTRQLLQNMFPTPICPPSLHEALVHRPSLFGWCNHLLGLVWVDGPATPMTAGPFS
jgi:hypothetical protein